jgi:hypothetical protein
MHLFLVIVMRQNVSNFNHTIELLLDVANLYELA